MYPGLLRSRREEAAGVGLSPGETSFMRIGSGFSISAPALTETNVRSGPKHRRMLRASGSEDHFGRASTKNPLHSRSSVGLRPPHHTPAQAFMTSTSDLNETDVVCVARRIEWNARGGNDELSGGGEPLSLSLLKSFGGHFLVGIHGSGVDAVYSPKKA